MTRDSIILEHLDWAHTIAHQVSALLPVCFTGQDLEGPAEIALVELADRYVPSRGVPFRAFARRRIYGACWDSIRRQQYWEADHDSLEGIFPASDAASPESAASAQQARRVWATVQMLPGRYAVVILAVYGGNLKFSELVPLLGVRESRLSQIHREALGMLRETAISLIRS